MESPKSHLAPHPYPFTLKLVGFDPGGRTMFTEHRHHPRFTLKLPVEVHTISREEVQGKIRDQVSDTPIRCTTSDISLGGCYIESMYPFPIGTRLELKLQISETLLILGRVVTSHPQFGNGIEFIKILPEDYDALSDFLDSAAKEQNGGSAPPSPLAP